VHPLKEQWLIGLDNFDHIARVATRLTLALVLGAALGYERQREGKAAGMRTHMLVCLGTALFIAVAIEAGMGHDSQ
jgi:putative Mg2+ transporter-C (MgtC) family protein